MPRVSHYREDVLDEVQKVPTDRIKAGEGGAVPKDRPLGTHSVTVVDCGELPPVVGGKPQGGGWGRPTFYIIFNAHPGRAMLI